MKKMPRTGSESDEFATFLDGLLNADNPACIFAVQIERVKSEKGNEMRAHGRMLTINVVNDHITVDLLRALAISATGEADRIEGVQR